ncbi:MAG: S8 family serine peptidase [Acidobacteria bacterium]|nr:S8 family serine peptidase [Acidobacteriota bacterium]
MKKFAAICALLALVSNALAGIVVERSNGITLTGADGIQYVGMNGISLTGADSLLTFQSNGITLTGADGITLTGADSIPRVTTNGTTYTGPNGITLTGADGITLTGADGITLTGADGITLTGADGTQYKADSILIRKPDGITLTGADGITLTGADGITLTGADGVNNTTPNVVSVARANGITLTGADGITLTGADGITLTGADSIAGMGPGGVIFDTSAPNGITLTGADGITLTGADGITLTGADGITLTGVDAAVAGISNDAGLQGFDPELAAWLNQATDDSSVNAIVVYHNTVTDADLDALRQIGILGGTRMRALPMVYVTATRKQIIAISHLRSVRSIYGNRTLNFNSDPYFSSTGVQRVATDRDLIRSNGGLPVSGQNVTVAVLDTGINSLHGDLAGKVVQNVRLADQQSIPSGFNYPLPIEGLPNTDLAGGHGTFVAGVIAGTGAASGGKYAGVAPGAKLLGLSAGDVNLINVLSGFDYLLDKGAAYNVKVVNCSFSANTVFDMNDPVNIATKMLTDHGVSVVFSAGNTGPGNGTMNPYAVAPWVIGVGATDQMSKLAGFSSRGDFGDSIQHPFIVAPGVNIVSLRNLPTSTGLTGLAGADLQRLSPGESLYYTTASGTSFSAPQVAGAIALMLDANPDLTPAQIKDILGRTATPLPKYFFHETGAGMLNTYAAVLEGAFRDRVMGGFRSVSSGSGVRFETNTVQRFTQTVGPSSAISSNISLPQNVVQASVNIAWGLGPNDFGLRLYDSNSVLVGESNYVNAPGFAGRFEKVVMRFPSQQILRAETRNTAGLGTTQNVYGTVEATQIVYPNLVDISGMSPASVEQIRTSLLTDVLSPQGRRFRPDSAVMRVDLAEAFVRAGMVPQYYASNPLFVDVRDSYSRNVIESAQSNPAGALFYDASPGGRFYPNNGVNRLVAAVAFVKAAKLENQAATAILTPAIADYGAIPAGWRGYVAVALQNGFLTLDGNRFNPSRSITRLELATALNKMIAN